MKKKKKLPTLMMSEVRIQRQGRDDQHPKDGRRKAGIGNVRDQGGNSPNFSCSHGTWSFVF